MTVEGAFKKDECYVELAGKFQGWSDNPFQIWIGSPVEPDAFCLQERLKSHTATTL